MVTHPDAACAPPIRDGSDAAAAHKGHRCRINDGWRDSLPLHWQSPG